MYQSCLKSGFLFLLGPGGSDKGAQRGSPLLGGWGLLHGVWVPLKRNSPGHQLPRVPKKHPEGLLRD